MKYLLLEASYNPEYGYWGKGFALIRLTDNLKKDITEFLKTIENASEKVKNNARTYLFDLEYCKFFDYVPEGYDKSNHELNKVLEYIDHGNVQTTILEIHDIDSLEPFVGEPTTTGCVVMNDEVYFCGEQVEYGEEEELWTERVDINLLLEA
jgi:hypothetical protein